MSILPNRSNPCSFNWFFCGLSRAIPAPLATVSCMVYLADDCCLYESHVRRAKYSFAATRFTVIGPGRFLLEILDHLRRTSYPPALFIWRMIDVRRALCRQSAGLLC